MPGTSERKLKLIFYWRFAIFLAVKAADFGQLLRHLSFSHPAHFFFNYSMTSKPSDSLKQEVNHVPFIVLSRDCVRNNNHSILLP